MTDKFNLILKQFINKFIIMYIIFIIFIIYDQHFLTHTKYKYLYNDLRYIIVYSLL